MAGLPATAKTRSRIELGILALLLAQSVKQNDRRQNNDGVDSLFCPRSFCKTILHADMWLAARQKLWDRQPYSDRLSVPIAAKCAVISSGVSTRS